LHPEDENRVIAYRLQSDPERVKKALLSQARDRAIVTGQKQFDPKDWLELHDMVANGSKKVHIPFATALASKIDAKQDRAMRDFPKLLGLIRAHALVHQETRKKNTDGIVATLADYEAVRGLIEPCLVSSQSGDFSRKVRDVVSAVQTLANGVGVSLSEVAKHLNVKPQLIQREVNTGLELGFIRNKAERQRKGVKKELVLGEVPLPDTNTLTPDKVLPEVSELGR
jgi:hypothetical protein